MDRRATLSTLLGRKSKKTNTAMVTPPDTTLEPYSGTWSFEQAAHLLRRTTFGPTFAQIKQAVDDGLDVTIGNLLADLPLPNPPLNFNNDADTVPVGEPWVDASYSDLTQLQSRTVSLIAWTMGQMINEGTSIREKMVLFWHNHFVTQIGVVRDPKFMYKYSSTMREYALGNFRELVKKITIDPAMLRYLNGNQNSRLAPNENYARELLELFTVGKGALAGPGDYTTFTEQDVAEIAKVLTGWRDVGYFDLVGVAVGANFINFRHDTTTKQLSHRFNNAVINNAGEDEYANLIDIIFEQAEVARFICRKLYRWFVYYQIDEATETNIIEPLAQIMIQNDYEIKPVLEVLLKSEYFYDSENIGCMIKNPMDFAIGLIKQFELEIPDQLLFQYTLWASSARFSTDLEMSYYDPPNVAGWKAYYQEPVFYQIWLNSVTLPIRQEFTSRIVTPGYQILNQQFVIDALGFLSKADEPADVNLLLNDFVKALFPKPISENQHDFLKEVLIPGLPDYEWNIEYTDYIVDPGNEALATGVRNKVQNLLRAMMAMPEYQLM